MAAGTAFCLGGRLHAERGKIILKLEGTH